MIEVSVKDAGAAISAAVDTETAKITKQFASRMTRALNEVRNCELQVLSGQRSGKRYRAPSGAWYTASAPGEPPARRTGKLRTAWSREVHITPTSLRSAKVEGAYISNTEYAEYLENGTGRMKPRPFLKPITEMAEPGVNRIFSEPYGS